MYPGADFYGIRKILLTYANLPTFLPLPVAVQHGWQRVAHSYEASANPPEIWVWSQRIASELAEYYPVSKIRVVGSVFYYLVEIIKNTLPQVEKKGSICIPPHSSHFSTAQYSVEEFARTLNNLEDEYKPITVMLYYLDMNTKTVDEYKKFGFKVVSNGSLFDEDFLNKFIFNVYDKQHCIFSDLGSGVLFAKDFGLNLIHLDIKSNIVNQGNIHITDEMISNSNIFDEFFLRSLDDKTLSLELGKESMLSPRELRRAILYNYFTRAFLTKYTRRFAGNILRFIGILKKVEKLK